MQADNVARVSCRLAQSKDIEFIYECLNELAHEQDIPEKFSQSHASLHHALFSDKAFAECIIAELNHIPAGLALYSVVNLNFTMHPAPCLYVHDIYVCQSFRRKGIAHVLGSQLKALAKEKQCSRIDGIILKNNETALAFSENNEGVRVLDYVNYMRLNIL